MNLLLRSTLLFLLFISCVHCTRESEKHPALISFDITLIPHEEVGFYRNLDPEAMGKVLELNTVKIADTLVVTNLLHTGNSVSYDGNIKFRNDSLILLLERGMGLREIATHRFTYRVLHPAGEFLPIGFE